MPGSGDEGVDTLGMMATTSLLLTILIPILSCLCTWYKPFSCAMLSVFKAIIGRTIRPDQQQTKSRFLSLPAELRVRIYEELLVVGKVFLDDHGRYTHHETPPREIDMNYYRKPSLAILRVSKLVHEEAEEVYLSKNLFVFPLG